MIYTCEQSPCSWDENRWSSHLNWNCWRKCHAKQENKRKKSEQGSQLLAVWQSTQALPIAVSNLNVLEKYKLVKILISSHPFNKIYLQAKNAVRCFSALLDKQFSMQLEQPSTDRLPWLTIWLLQKPETTMSMSTFFIGCTVIHPVSLPRS